MNHDNIIMPNRMLKILREESDGDVWENQVIDISNSIIRKANQEFE